MFEYPALLRQPLSCVGRQVGLKRQHPAYELRRRLAAIIILTNGETKFCSIRRPFISLKYTRRLQSKASLRVFLYAPVIARDATLASLRQFSPPLLPVLVMLSAEM